ncbi:MAG: Lar family restriction alleviation protein [Desulfarculales bacterium]|jgi:hypothetical protein|nr:Lar family restriction alleviation protein [Desulfarculales bacterium]
MQTTSFKKPGLKPCPFCACDIIEIAFDEQLPGYLVFCAECGQNSLWWDERKRAITAWNSRAIEDSLHARIVKLEKTILNYQIFPHPGREAAIRKILPYIVQARPGLSQEKAFQRAWMATFPDACAILLADKAPVFKEAFAQSELGQWPFTPDDPVRTDNLWKSWVNTFGVNVNVNAECSLAGEIQLPVQGIEAVIPFILEAGDTFDEATDRLINGQGEI